MKKLLFIMIGIILLLPTGCDDKNTPRLQDDETTATDYVKSLGCTIITNEGETSRYVLDRDMFNDIWYMRLWAVQKSEPESYIGKEIVTYDFIVSDHPLEKKYASMYKENNYDTSVMIMLVDGKVIGGGSTPKSRTNVVVAGGYYSVDGEAQETITGLSYSEWLDEWKQKYGEQAE